MDASTIAAVVPLSIMTLLVGLLWNDVRALNKRLNSLHESFDDFKLNTERRFVPLVRFNEVRKIVTALQIQVAGCPQCSPRVEGVERRNVPD